MLNISGIISKFVKNSSQRELDKLNSVVEKINNWESKIKDMPDESFPSKTAELKSKIKKGNKLEKAPRKFFLIDTLQVWKQSFSKNISGIANVDMQFNYLIKEIIWVIQRNDVLTRSNDDDEDFSYGNDTFNFSDSKRIYFFIYRFKPNRICKKQ